MLNSSNQTLFKEKVLTPEDYNIIGVYLVCLGTLSILSNAFVIFVLLKGRPKFHTTHNILLLNISVSDLLLSSVAYPLWATTTFYNRWIWPQALCPFSGFWCFTLAQTDMNTLVAIAVCRYIIVCKPQYEFYLKKPRAKYYIVTFLWGYSIVNTAPPLFGWSTYKQEAFETSCSIDWTGTSADIVSYNIIITITCYVVHIVIFAYCYTKIIKRFKDMPIPIFAQGGTMRLENVVWYHKVSTSVTVTVTSMAMVTVFLITWTPYTFASIYTMLFDGRPKWILIVPTMFAKSCTLLNPVVCAMMSSKFRKASRKVFKRETRVTPGNIEMVELDQATNPTLNRACDESRTYQGNMTQNDIFLGEMAITIPVDDHLV